MRYFAAFENVHAELAIFETEAVRDEWVNYRDWHSVATNTTKENCPLNRVALTESEARNMAGDLLDCPECFDRDNLLDNVCWVSIV